MQKQAFLGLILMFYSFTITFLTLSNKSFFEISRLIEASPMELATINLIIPESIFYHLKLLQQLL